MDNYRKINNIIGWFLGILASAIYIITSEPTVSLWDCGEYITTAYKLEVGHPPGAPFFQMIGRIFSLFSFGNEALVARMINSMSAISSGLTIMFLFWTITMLAKKIICPGSKASRNKMYVIFASAIVGSLAYTFTDSFWFSAVEGEVYAMSSFFTAVTFWAILKWEQVADQKDSWRWLILIAYLIGLSIGVHLLNLLAIPAIVFVFYFKKFKTSRKGNFYASIISLLLLAGILYGIIPLIVKLSGLFELFFVNSLGLPFNSGTIFYFALLISGIVWVLQYAIKKEKSILKTIIISFVFLLIGYSSFFLLIIRSNANPPLDENNPEDAVSLLAYLQREQYGSSPLIKGHYYNSEIIDWKDGKKVWVKSKEKGKYVIKDDRKNTEPVYNPEHTTIFPRMWNNQQSSYISNYKTWAGIENDPNNKHIPTFGENIRFFFSYQLGHMYFRYFMWNFAGRQNDNQNRGSMLDGNWMSGIKFIDKMRLGPADDVPVTKKNEGTNTYYFLPLILGLIGFFYHIKKHPKDTLVVALLFFMTGIAIVIYLNQKAYEPRERDYAFAASFYAFSIWIGLGVISIYDSLRKKLPETAALITAFIGSLILVPGILASENWDDHDRSGKYCALDIAHNYLNSCAPHSILFTNGDNDTFPLWYAQEVEGIRTDVRVVNLSLLSTDWYVDQMKRKAYESAPLPISFSWDQYKQGTRDILPVDDKNQKGIFVEVGKVIDFVKNDAQKLRTRHREYSYIPTTKFKIPVDSATIVNKGIVKPENAGLIEDVKWTMNYASIQKNKLMQLDILAHFNWERPVYFAITTGNDAYIGLTKYFQLEGMAYRLVPIHTEHEDALPGRIDTDILYDNVMNKFYYRNLNDPEIYLNEDNRRMAMNFRSNFGRLAGALVHENKLDSALKACEKSEVVMPHNCLPYDYYMIPVAEAYQRCGQAEKSYAVIDKILEVAESEAAYYLSFDPGDQDYISNEIGFAAFIIRSAILLTIPVADDYYSMGRIEEANTMVKRITKDYQHYLRYALNEQETSFIRARLANILQKYQQEDLLILVNQTMGGNVQNQLPENLNMP